MRIRLGHSVVSERSNSADTLVGGGSFEVVNNTGGPVSVVVAGQLYTVASGSLLISLLTGSYTAKVSARCGLQRNPLTWQGSVFTGTYTCERTFR